MSHREENVLGVQSPGDLSPDSLPYAALNKVLQIQDLQLQLNEAKDALQRERDKATLLAQELDRLRLSVSGATSPALYPSSPLSNNNDLTTTATGISSAPPRTSSFPHLGPMDDLNSGEEDMVSVPRATLELLYLKERAMDAVKEGITIADATQPEMPLLYINEGFTRITGYPTEFARGRNCRFLQGKGTDSETVEVLKNAIAAGQPCVVQITNYKRSGDPFINYLSLTPVHDAAGSVTHYVGVQSDITDMVQQRQAELAAKHAAVQAAAATEAKSQFLARMSHEIRTPLNGMIAVGQMLADTELSPGQWDLVNTIRCSGEALLTLITDILDFSKIEANKMVLSRAPFFLESTIEAAMEIAGLHAARKRLQVAYHVVPGVPHWVVGDAQRLQQILLNILNNALKFTDSGEVLLEVWAQPARPLPPPQISTKPVIGSTNNSTNNRTPTSPSTVQHHQECEVHFSVRDTGIGIQSADLARLFQSFSQVDASPTRRFGGSGLGLTISQKLSEAMGGRMWAESDGLGRGSTFRWCIRTEAATPSQPEPRRRSRDDGVLRGKRVLLVESCPMVREVMLLSLRRWGCQVCAVSTEREALTKLKLVAAINPSQSATMAAATTATTTTAAAVPPPSSSSSSTIIGGLTLQSSALEELRAATVVSKACSGPFDVVVMDLEHASVLRALMDECCPEEARRVVFLGWPGQRNPEGEAGNEENTSPRNYTTTTSTSATAASNEFSQQQQPLSINDAYVGDVPDVAAPPPPSELVAGGHRRVPGRRQLGFVVVSRPVRQGRLRLGLEEVLEMVVEEVDGSTNGSRGASSGGVDCGSPDDSVAAVVAAINAGARSGGGVVGAALGGEHLNIPSHMMKTSDSKSEVSSSENSHMKSVASTGSLLQAPVRRISSGSSLAEGGAVRDNTNASRKLLLAEDNAINMKVALGILRRLGFTNVVTAPDGEAAVAAVAAVGGPAAFDAILMDLHMPKKGGIEAVQDIIRMWPQQRTKIIAVTADAFEDTRDTCVANGFTGWLAKPFRVEEFARIMGQG